MLMKFLIWSIMVLAPIVLLTDCGGTYKVDVSGQVDVVASLNPDSILAAFVALCTQQLGTAATQAQITSCADADVANLIQSLQTIIQ